MDDHEAPRTPLAQLAWLFLRLGATTFGGPAAYIAVFQHEIVRRRRWVTDERFLDLVSAANLIPGPNSAEIAIHIGYIRRGFPGLLVAGLAFILPAVLLSGLLAWLYVQYQYVPRFGHILRGLHPALVAIIAHACVVLAPKAAPNWPLRVLAVAVATASLLGVEELPLLLLGGLAALALTRPRGAAAFLPALVAAPVGAHAVGAASILAVCAKIGCLLYGGGYVLFAFLRTEFVERLHWLTERQLLDAISVGQLTPGPLFSSVTFVGFLLDGPLGAAAATVGIFLPAFVFVAISGALVQRLRRSPTASAFLDGVNAASLALMAAVAVHLARSGVHSVADIAVCVGAFVALLRFNLQPLWIIAAGAALGLMTHSP